MLDGALLSEGRATAPAYRAAVLAAAGASSVRRFAFELHRGPRRFLYDGRACRPGGPRCANDPRGTGLRANCALYSDGWLLVLRDSAVPALRAGLSATQQAKAELLWDYGDGYWAASLLPTAASRSA